MVALPELVLQSMKEVIRMIGENPTPRTTHIRMDTGILTSVQTPLGHGRYSIQFARPGNTVELPIGTSAKISTGRREFIVDDFRPRRNHDPGVRVRKHRLMVALNQDKDSANIPHLGTVTYRKSEW